MMTKILLLAGTICAAHHSAYSQSANYGYLSGTNGSQNSFFGVYTGANTTANANTMVGFAAGLYNTSGEYNTFIGVQAGVKNTSGSANFFAGTNAGGTNTTGYGNYFLGPNSGGGNTSGSFNIYIGANAGNGAGVNGDNNLALGFEAGTKNNGGLNNAFLGFRANAGASGLLNAMAIGNNAIVSQSNSLVLGGTDSDAVKVGIGVTKPQYTLTVNGTIGAREVNVTTETWSDFVFDKTYKLLPLSDVERSIQRNKHLPGIPSAKEVIEKGVDVGMMQAKLLQKIEELTLYAIRQQKIIERLTRLNRVQQKR